MKGKQNMGDFVRGRCEAAKEPEVFITHWFRTKRKPCLICGKDKSKCLYYRELVEKGVIKEK
jgi:hypothetical protein